ncbi:PEN family class A beta-lactamase, Bpc-type [Actinomadura viridis]|uniref:Beta-lactamase class A n=1 Tax=Actinomadura viridis TaxID=58110 RepID=A0A931GQJ7_9ACTN|nr:class A beta-lactamase [Actinomadura viridis]MBG6088609.1 beta-lactamase class A [Actinomadura viridis]
MQTLPSSTRRRTRWGLALLTAVTLAGGTACGAGAAPATRAAAPAGGSAAVTVTPAGQAEVRERLRALEVSYQGRIGVFALDTGNGRTISYRDRETFPLLSTFKAIAAAAALDKARRSDPGLMERRVHWTAEEEVTHSPRTGGRGEAGMTVAELCEAAITYSDNTAGNMVLKQIGGPAGLTRYFRSLGDPLSRLDRWETDLNIWRPGERRDTTNPAALGRDLHRLTVGDALAAPDRDRLNGWLKANTTGDTRIRAGLPKDWTVGDKTGTGPTYAAANDVAIAWPPSGAPLIISIYTNRKAPEGANDNSVIARTATIVARGLGKIG